MVNNYFAKVPRWAVTWACVGDPFGIDCGYEDPSLLTTFLPPCGRIESNQVCRLIM